VQRFNELTKAERVLTETEVEEVFNQLPAVSPEAMIGKWTGGSFNTGHPTHKQLEDYKWAGKDFHSINEVDPIMLWDDQGNRTRYTEFGTARVRTEIDCQTFCVKRSSMLQIREVKFRGVVTAAMIYDKIPIIDYFHHVSEGVVMGAMDNKDLLNDGTYYFILPSLNKVLRGFRRGISYPI
jgi:hypothetical protein